MSDNDLRAGMLKPEVPAGHYVCDECGMDYGPDYAFAKPVETLAWCGGLRSEGKAGCGKRAVRRHPAAPTEESIGLYENPADVRKQFKILTEERDRLRADVKRLREALQNISNRPIEKPPMADRTAGIMKERKAIQQIIDAALKEGE